jgi:hypothetical protein
MVLLQPLIREAVATQRCTKRYVRTTAGAGVLRYVHMTRDTLHLPQDFPGASQSHARVAGMNRVPRTFDFAIGLRWAR